MAWMLEIWNEKTFCSRKLNRLYAQGKDLGGPCDRLWCGDDCVDSCNVILSSANELVYSEMVGTAMEQLTGRRTMKSINQWKKLADFIVYSREQCVKIST